VIHIQCVINKPPFASKVVTCKKLIKEIPQVQYSVFCLKKDEEKRMKDELQIVGTANLLICEIGEIRVICD
jgi:hypothetical protein